MKTMLPPALPLLLASALFAADAGSKDQVLAAAKKLGDAPNYSWKATVVVPESVQFRPGPTEGQAEKDGFIHVKWSFGDNSTEAVLKGGKAVLTNREGQWQLAGDLENAEGPGRFFARRASTLKAPAAQIADLVSHVKDWKQEGDVHAGELTDEGARAQFPFGEPQNPKGSVRFWVKDGLLSKFEVKVQATMDFNGNEFDASRTSTTEIKEVGTTKLNVPEGAKQKLN